MVYTKRKNEKACANPSKIVFSKKKNNLFIQKVREYSLYEKGEHLNLFVHNMNDSIPLHEEYSQLDGATESATIAQC